MDWSENDEIWIATTGDSPYIGDTLSSCRQHLPNTPVKLLKYGKSQLGNIREHLSLSMDRPQRVLLLDDDDILIRTPPSVPFSLGVLYMSCNEDGHPYRHTSGVTNDSVEEYMQIWDHLLTTDFSGTIVPTDDLMEYFSIERDMDCHVGDVVLMRFILDRYGPLDVDTKAIPWVWGRCKQEISAWKQKTIKQLEGQLKVATTLARAKVPGHGDRVQSLTDMIQKLKSNVYISPLNQ